MTAGAPAEAGTGRGGWNPSSTAMERRAFYQRRLSLFAQIFFYVFVVLLIWVNLMYYLQPILRPEKAGLINYVAGGGLVALGLLWRLVLVKRPVSQGSLFALDILLAEVIGIVLGFAGAMSPDKPVNVASMLVWALLMIFARVSIIPSRGTRTLLVSFGALLPQVACAIFIVHDRATYLGAPKYAFVVGVAIYVAVATLLAGLGSEVIYGLRRKVQEAQQLGQYTLTEKIGAGGMGTVYKARHSMLRRPTALKLLSPGRTSDEALGRFEREVQLTSELTHPNTIAIFDYGRSPDGVFYYAMEYLEGIDLERLVATHGPQPANRVVHILTQVCEALDEAHDRGLIHRDIKPANIILCWRGKIPDVAKVLDFGLVKDIEDPSMSSTDTVAGTPAYIAPETIVAPEKIGPGTDLYALGAVGYFLLTGRTVFSAKSTVEMCMHHVATAAGPPSGEVAGIPARLDEIIHQCLAKNPEDRPKSAEELREALLAVPLGSHWTREDARSWWEDNPSAPGEAAISRSAHDMTVNLRGHTVSGSKRDRLLGLD